MLTAAELKLRKAAFLLTGLLCIVLLWGGGRLLLLSQPEPVLPAASSLQVGDIGVVGATEDFPPDFVSRPLFWMDRTAYVAPREDGEPEPEPRGRNGDLDKVKLLGLFGTGPNATAIVMHKGKAQRLNLNETIEGWTFTQFSPDGAFFEKGMESRALNIEHATPVAPARPVARIVARPQGATAAPRRLRADDANKNQGGNDKSKGKKDKKDKKDKKNKKNKSKKGEK